VPVHLDPDLVWDFRLPRVASINTSGHKFGLVYPGVGWVLWRDADALPDELVFKVNYLGGEMPTLALNFSRPGGQVVAQYYTFLRLGWEGYRQVQQECRNVAMYTSLRIAELGPFRLLTRGDELPVFAFTFPANREDLAALRVVVRNGTGRELSDLLVDDLAHLLPRLQRQAVPVRGTEARGFDHATAQRKS
jgi:glutamate decarboxylase